MTWFSSKFSIFNSLFLFFFSLSIFFFYPKSDCLPFSQKICIFGKIWYQKRILCLISIPGLYTFIFITVIIWKLRCAIFFTISGFTLLLNELFQALMLSQDLEDTVDSAKNLVPRFLRSMESRRLYGLMS